MTIPEYRAALAELGWSQLEAGRLLGVGPRTAQRYASETGPSGPAERLIRLALHVHRHGRLTARDLAALLAADAVI